MENLFSYGTLQSASVQLDTFNRILDGFEDVLTGFKLSMVKIEDAAVIASSGLNEHPILTYTNDADDQISGTVFSITEKELQQADEYEVADYKRVGVTLKSGKEAWVYVSADTQI